MYEFDDAIPTQKRIIKLVHGLATQKLETVVVYLVPPVLFLGVWAPVGAGYQRSIYFCYRVFSSIHPPDDYVAIAARTSPLFPQRAECHGRHNILFPLSACGRAFSVYFSHLGVLELV
jgi:hypothetical protein